MWVVNKMSANKRLEIVELKVKHDEPHPLLVLKIKFNSHTKAFIFNSNLNMILLRAANPDKRFTIEEMNLIEKDRKLHPGDNYLDFRKELSPSLVKALEEFRDGDNLKLALGLDLWMVSYDYSVDDSSVNRFGQIEHFSYNNLGRMSEYKIITREDWIEKVLNSLGFGKRFIVEVPCELPDIGPLAVQEPSLQNFKDRIERGARELNSAMEKMAKGDKDGAIERVRIAADTLHGFLHQPDVEIVLADYLMVRSNTTTQNVATDFIRGFSRIVDALFYMASKGPHAVTRRTGQLMDYHPEIEDAETLIGIALMVFRYLSKKFERSTII